jgi:hypothetical protein
MTKRSMLSFAVILLAGGIWGGAANAMPLAARAISGPALNGGVVQNAAVVCGYYGCVHTYPRYWGYPYAYHGYYRPYRYHRWWW